MRNNGAAGFTYVGLMVMIAVGILGALFAVLGIAQRIKEYL